MVRGSPLTLHLAENLAAIEVLPQDDVQVASLLLFEDLEVRSEDAEHGALDVLVHDVRFRLPVYLVLNGSE